METTTSTASDLLKLSDSAASELKRLTQTFPAGQMVRIGVKGGGCSGLTYILDQTVQQTDDIVLQFDDLKIAVAQSHALYLQGVELDFGSGLDNRGFIFNNPNASSTCGCGTSFAI
jgi:iron-sulfur cluster assembly protein